MPRRTRARLPVGLLVGARLVGHPRVLQVTHATVAMLVDEQVDGPQEGPDRGLPADPWRDAIAAQRLDTVKDSAELRPPGPHPVPPRLVERHVGDHPEEAAMRPVRTPRRLRNVLADDHALQLVPLRRPLALSLIASGPAHKSGSGEPAQGSRGCQRPAYSGQ